MEIWKSGNLVEITQLPASVFRFPSSVMEYTMTFDFSLDDSEAELLKRAMSVYKKKHKERCQQKDVVIEALEIYLELYEREYGEQDDLSRVVVYGPRSVKAQETDLDEVARLLVNCGKCMNCGTCCKRTIGVSVRKEEIEKIEKLGYKREEFLESDGLIKAGPGGCYFLVIKRDSTTRCRIHEHRPEICRNYFCDNAKGKRC